MKASIVIVTICVIVIEADIWRILERKLGKVENCHLMLFGEDFTRMDYKRFHYLNARLVFNFEINLTHYTFIL